MWALTQFDVVVVIVDVDGFSSALGTIIASARRHQVVDLHIGVTDALLSWSIISTSGRVRRLALLGLLFVLVALFAFLLVGIFVIDTVVKILIIQFFVVAIKLAHSRMESDHQVFVAHEALSLLYDARGRLLASLRVEGAKDDGARRIILHQRVLMSLNAALGELRVEIVGPSRSLLDEWLAT